MQKIRKGWYHVVPWCRANTTRRPDHRVSGTARSTLGTAAASYRHNPRKEYLAFFHHIRHGSKCHGFACFRLGGLFPVVKSVWAEINLPTRLHVGFRLRIPYFWVIKTVSQQGQEFYNTMFNSCEITWNEMKWPKICLSPCSLVAPWGQAAAPWWLVTETPGLDSSPALDCNRLDARHGCSFLSQSWGKKKNVFCSGTNWTKPRVWNFMKDPGQNMGFWEVSGAGRCIKRPGRCSENWTSSFWKS